MKVHDLKLSLSRWCEVDELQDYDLKCLPNDVEEIWYWYATAPYEGSGHILARKGNVYGHDDMGHCSCYGPCENINLEPYMTLDAIEAEVIDGAGDEVLCLVRAARQERLKGAPGHVVDKDGGGE